MKFENKIYVCWITFLALFVVGSFILGTCSCQASCLVDVSNSSGHGMHITEISGVSIKNMTVEESMFLLGPGHNLNVSKDGILTMQNGTTWKIVTCPVTTYSEEDHKI